MKPCMLAPLLCELLLLVGGASAAETAPFGVLHRGGGDFVEASGTAVPGLSEIDTFRGALTPVFDPALGTLTGLDFQPWVLGTVHVGLAAGEVHPSYEVVTTLTVGVYTFEPLVVGGGALIDELTWAWATTLPANVGAALFQMPVGGAWSTPVVAAGTPLFDQIVNPGLGFPPSAQLRLSLSMAIEGCVVAACAPIAMDMRFEASELRLDGRYLYTPAVPELAVTWMWLCGTSIVAIATGRGFRRRLEAQMKRFGT